MRSPISSVILFASLSSVAMAQFGFFDHMFGNHQSQQQKEQQAPLAGSQWATHANAVACSSYLCPDSLVCVSRPSECPCAREEDIKCVIPDAIDTQGGAVVCVRGVNGCALVERLAGSSKQANSAALP